MPRLRFGILILFTLCSFPAVGQQTSIPVVRDPQATRLLESSVNTMAGPSVPLDSVASGTIEIVAGSQTTNGTIRIMTKGNSETLVNLSTPSLTDEMVFANGQANEISSGVTTTLSLERTQASQAVEFPFAFISSLLANSDVSFRFVGPENLNGQLVVHVQTSDTFSSQPQWQMLSSFSTHDIWLAASSGLPVRISCIQTDAQGAPGTAWDVYFSNYQKTQGVEFPMTITESLNGTPWATITIQTVTFNNGLADAAFPIQQVGANQ